MDSLTVTDFRERCLHLIDHLPPEEILITKRGKPVARLVRLTASCSDLIGKIKKLTPNNDDDLFTTGINWDAQS